MHKVCKKCLIDKPLEEYYKASKAKDKHFYVCKECDSKRTRQYKIDNREKGVLYSQNYRKKYGEKYKDYNINCHYKSKYNITLEDYNTILALQDGKCAICGTTKSTGISERFHVDHCHTTGKVRGLLCHDCNTGIGKLKDDIKLLTKALEYLEKFNNYGN